jgi:hypothetical protein
MTMAGMTNGDPGFIRLFLDRDRQHRLHTLQAALLAEQQFFVGLSGSPSVRRSTSDQASIA